MESPRQVHLTLLPSHPCPYLPDREARSAGFLCGRMSAEVYRGLLDAGFRRSGKLVYRPACAGCRECRAMRIAVDGFVMSKSQRRVWRRNQDLVVTVNALHGRPSPRPSPGVPGEGEREKGVRGEVEKVARARDEKFQLYARYVREWHGREEDATEAAFVEFLYDSPVLTLEVEYRDEGGKLLGVGICDRSRESLSSVYFYFDPSEARRGLGTFGVLWEIDFARRERIDWYYLGYWIRGCSAMEYKARFGPHEILGEDGVWRKWSAGAGG